MTQPPPYGSSPQQPDQWGQQPAPYGQQQPQPGVYGRAQPGVYGQPQQDQWEQQPSQPGVYGQQRQDQWEQQPAQPGVYGQPRQDQWGQQPADQWGQAPQSPADQWGQAPQSPADQWGQPPQSPGQWGQPPQSPPGQWGQQPPPPPQRQGTNGFAIASLIFGFVALSQIRKRGQGGRGLAIAGITLSGVWLVGIVSLVIIGIVASGGGTNDPSTNIADGGDVNVQRLAAGQCLNGLKEGSAIRDLPAVACTEPHEGEVFATFDLSGGSFPGDNEVAKLAEDGCVDRLKTYSAKAADDPNVEIYFLHPTRTSWTLGDKGVACVAMSSTGKVTGSIKD